jgi:hypothetical protein
VREIDQIQKDDTSSEAKEQKMLKGFSLHTTCSDNRHLVRSTGVTFFGRDLQICTLCNVVFMEDTSGENKSAHQDTDFTKQDLKGLLDAINTDIATTDLILIADALENSINIHVLTGGGCSSLSLLRDRCMRIVKNRRKHKGD